MAVARRFRAPNSAEFRAQWDRYMHALQRHTLTPGHFTGQDLIIESVKLVHLLPHDKQVPVADTKLFEKTVREFSRRRMPKNIREWLGKHTASLDLLVRSGRWPDKGTSKEQSQDVLLTVEEHGIDATLSVHNLTGRDVSANMKMLETAANLMLASGLPGVDRIVYGDVYFAGNIDRRKNVLAKYYIEKDNVFILKVDRFETTIVHSIIHEFGHRYWHKILKSQPGRQRIEWAKHHQQVRRDVPMPDAPQPGATMQTKKGTHTVVRIDVLPKYGQVVVLDDGGHVLLGDYLRVEHHNAVRRAYPTLYAATDEQEHFCEALAGLCLGDLAPQHVEAFVRIFDVERAPPPAPAEPERVARPSTADRGQLSMFNPSRRASAAARRIARS